MIEEGDIFPDDVLSMPFAEDQDMVQAFAPDRTEEPLTQRIGFRRLEGGVEQFRVDAGNGAFKQHAIFVVIIANQEAGPAPETRCLTDLLSHPSITRSTRDGEVNHASRAVFDNRHYSE